MTRLASLSPLMPKMWRTLDTTTTQLTLTVRALRLRSHHLFSSSSSSTHPKFSHSSYSPSSFRTIVTLTHSHSFLSSAPKNTRYHDFGSKFVFSVKRCVSSSFSSSPSLDWNDAVSCSEVDDGIDDVGGDDHDVKPSSIPVRAFFFSTSVDLKSLVEQNKPNFVTPSSRMTNYVVLRFGNLSDSRGLGTAFLSGNSGCYMVVFQYGSIVLFNVPEHEVDSYLKIVKTHASGLLPEMRKDEYEVREKQALSTWMQGGLDYIMLQYLNIDGIRTIGSVLGQSIALDYYGRQVDGMVAEFTDINREMEATGKFKMQRKKLFQLVGKANSNLADVILKLGLFERSDIAWKDAKYAQIWEYLRDEFELTQRFASLDFKLKFVEHNIRFLQEILQNRKSDFLEWLIIALIGAEILLSLYDIIHRGAMQL
ncbi:unnamed protein product [Lupinus luteus]|uniref:DUF155 domain-containing protein n=1 Tax=Lupinus luteus TaxID=3873 RepID=A0AAV1YHE3_LUPLU